MTPPNTLRIPLDEGLFENIGRLPDGTQFMAYVTGAMPDGMKYPSHSEAERYKQWLAVIHRFDPEGNHIGSEVRLGAFDRGGRTVAAQKAWEQLEEMSADLTTEGETEFCNIRVKPFSVTIDGIKHGLLYEQFQSEEEEEEYVMLEPCDIMFHPPWESGEYSTRYEPVWHRKRQKCR